MKTTKSYKSLPPYVYKALKLTTTKAISPLLGLVLKVDNRVVALDRELTYEHRSREVANMPDGLYELVGQSLVFSTDDRAAYRVDLDRLFKPMHTVKLPATAFDRVLPLLGKDDLRPAMTGVLVDLVKKGDELLTVGTDGHALGISRAKVGHVPTNGQCIVPAKVAKLHTLLGAGTLNFRPEKGGIGYESDTVYFKPVDERYPDYKSALAQSFPTRHLIDADALKHAISQLPKPEKKQRWVIGCKQGEWKAFMVEETYGGYEPMVKQAPVSLLVTKPRTGMFTVSKPDGVLLMPVQFNDYDQPGEIAFNAVLLLKCLNAVGSDRWINLDMSAYNRATFLSVAGAEKIPKKGLSVRTKAPAKPAVSPLMLRARALKLKLALLQL